MILKKKSGNKVCSQMETIWLSSDVYTFFF